MSHDLPSDSELDALSLQVDAQLQALQQAPAGVVRLRGRGPGEQESLPAAPVQQALIEHATGAPFESFWDKFKRSAQRDLCLPGGQLHLQWQRWRDLRSRDSVKVAFGIIAGMGIPTASIAPIAVAASVFLINTVANIGIGAICEGCAEAAGGPAAAKPPAPRRKAAGDAPA